MESWSLSDAEFTRAAGKDAARQKYGVKGPHPSSAQLFFAQMRFAVAGEFAGAQNGFGGIGAQWAHLAQVSLVALPRIRKQPRECWGRKMQTGNSPAAVVEISRRSRVNYRGLINRELRGALPSNARIALPEPTNPTMSS